MLLQSNVTNTHTRNALSTLFHTHELTGSCDWQGRWRMSSLPPREQGQFCSLGYQLRMAVVSSGFVLRFLNYRMSGFLLHHSVGLLTCISISDLSNYNERDKINFHWLPWLKDLDAKLCVCWGESFDLVDASALGKTWFWTNSDLTSLWTKSRMVTWRHVAQYLVYAKN